MTTVTVKTGTLIALSVAFVSGIIPGCWGLRRIPRRTGDQAPSGQCQTLNWGGISGAHWYVCCNNCDDDDATCDGTTYHSASREDYCDTCGVDSSKGNGRIRGTYACGGCTGQNKILQECTAGLKTVFQVPGLCWAFVHCFEWRCEQYDITTSRSGAHLMADSVSEDVCFDLVCGEGETVESCPTDCCGTINDVCDWRKYNGTNDCPPVCCSESTCCGGTSGAERMLRETVMLLVTAFGVLMWRLL